MSRTDTESAPASDPRRSLRPSFWPAPPAPDPVQERSHRRRAWSDAWAARGVTLGVHLVTLALAAWPTLALTSAVTSAVGPAPVEQGVLIDLVRHGGETGLLGAFLAVPAAGLMLLLLTIPVQLTWIAALGGEPPRRALEQGLRRTPVALGVSLAVGAIAVLVIGLASVPVYFLHAGYRGEPNARTHDLLVLAGLVAPFVLALAASAWLDLARAACLRHGFAESVKRGWWALRPASGTFTWVLLARTALGLPLLLLTLPPLAALVLLQLAALLATFLRSRWLAEARRHVGPKIPSSQ